MAEVDDGSEQTGPSLSAPTPLTGAHDLAGFDCGEPSLNDWLRHRALKNESRFSRTYVVCKGNRVVAYFCISAGAIERAAAPGRLRRNAPDTIPVSYRRAFERTRSEAQGKPERAPALMRRTPSHRRVDAKARGYNKVID
jgi:hypothetical protein